MSVEALFLQFSADKLGEFNEQIEVCLGKLTFDQIWARGSQGENAIGNLVLHLTGNVRQWIVSSLGGHEWARDRDGEFSASGGLSAGELAAGLRGTVDEARDIIRGLDTERLLRTYDIQRFHSSGVEAVYHVVEHFAMHTGQIIFVTKSFTS